MLRFCFSRCSVCLSGTSCLFSLGYQTVLVALLFLCPSVCVKTRLVPKDLCPYPVTKRDFCDFSTVGDVLCNRNRASIRPKWGCMIFDNRWK